MPAARSPAAGGSVRPFVLVVVDNVHVVASIERDGVTYELIVDDATSWSGRRVNERTIEHWSFFVRNAEVVPPELPRRWDLRAVGVDPFA